MRTWRRELGVCVLCLFGVCVFAVTSTLLEAQSPRDVKVPTSAALVGVEDLRADLAGRALQGMLSDFDWVQTTAGYQMWLRDVQELNDQERAAAIKDWFAVEAVAYADSLIAALEH